MKYELDTWRSGTEQRGLSVPDAAGLLADWETILVGAVATESSNWLERGEASPALTLVLWGNPLAGEDGEPRFVMRWASGSPVPPGSPEVVAMHRVIARAGQVAALAEKLRDDEDAVAADPGEGEAPDLVHDLTAIAIAAMRSPDGTSPAAAMALARMQSILGIDGATPVDETEARIRAALQEDGHADR